MIKLALLGASGSIGKQVINVINEHPTCFALKGISVNTNIDCLPLLAKQFPSIELFAVTSNDAYLKAKELFPDLNITNNCLELIEDSDMVVNAIVGMAGLLPTLHSIRKNKDLALANKESIVCGGELILDLLKTSKSKIYPIDSEHSAIFQCLVGEEKKAIKRLILTASGGPFRDVSLDEIKKVTKKEALNHPNWSMGNKITIDSATMVNKGLEIIEAHYLFGIDYECISSVIHYESIIHSMVEFKDCSIKAQMGIPSMEIPIQYALFKGNRKTKLNQELDFTNAFNLRFKPIDLDRFEAVKLAYYVGNKGGAAPLIYNASNEAAVSLFLNDHICFYEIIEIIKDCIKTYENCVVKDIDDVLNLDKVVREYAYNKYGKER